MGEKLNVYLRALSEKNKYFYKESKELKKLRLVCKKWKIIIEHFTIFGKKSKLNEDMEKKLKNINGFRRNTMT